MDISPVCYKVSYDLRTVVKEQGAFRQMPIATGDTVCTVKVVLVKTIT